MLGFDMALRNVLPPLAVAVSGGSDSLALLLLTKKWAEIHQARIIALTVDHGLRSGSLQEAQQVQTWVTQHGIEHVILTWEGPKPASRLQEKAREVRYELLTSWCRENGVSTLLLGHHQEDQEETFWLRLAGGSGLEGLTAMKERSTRKGVLLLRPLLNVKKTSLQSLLKAENQEWIEDPSNKSSLFLRSKLRSVLATEGLSSSRLLTTMKKLEEDKDFIHGYLQEALTRILCSHEEGYLSLAREPFINLHPALSKRILALCIQWFSSSPYPPRSEQLMRVKENIEKGIPFTAGKIYWFFQKEKIYLMREPSRIPPLIWIADMQNSILWDNRCWIKPEIKSYFPKNAFIAPLGNKASLLPHRPHVPFPRRVWPSLLACWAHEKVVAVPHLGYTGFVCGKDLREFISVKPVVHSSLRLTI